MFCCIRVASFDASYKLLHERLTIVRRSSPFHPLLLQIMINDLDGLRLFHDLQRATRLDVAPRMHGECGVALLNAVDEHVHVRHLVGAW